MNAAPEIPPIPRSPFPGIESFRYVDRAVFFAREEEVERLVRAVVVYRATLLYGDSGCGKSSLINAAFLPRMLAGGFTPHRLRLQPKLDAEILVERIATSADGRGPFLPSIFTDDDRNPERTVITVEEFRRKLAVFRQSSLEERIVCALATASDPVTENLRMRFPQDLLGQAAFYDATRPLPETLRQPLDEALHRALQDTGLFPAELLQTLSLSERTRSFEKMLSSHPSLAPTQRAAFQRFVLEDAYPPVPPPRHQPLVIFDQFEEFVTLFEIAPPRAELAEARQVQEMVLEVIVSLVRDPALPVKVLFVFREDYLAKLSRLFQHCPELPEQHLRLTPPAPEKLPQIIRGAFDQFPGHFHREISTDLAQRLAEAIKEENAGAPVNLSELEVACLELWESDDPDQRFAQEGVSGLLEHYLERQIKAFPDAYRDAAIALLSRLVTSYGTRNIVSEPDLVDGLERDEAFGADRLRKALDALAGTRLVRKEVRNEVFFFEIVSEALVPWIGEKRQAQKQAEQVKRAAEEAARREQEAASQRDKAIEAQKKLSGVLSQAQLSLARYSKNFGKNGQALAHLAQALRLNQSNSAAATITAAMLTQAGWPVLLAGPMHDQAIYSAQFSPDGQLIVTASEDETARLWDALSGKAIGKSMRHGNSVYCAQFSPDGQLVVTASKDKTARLWDAATGEALSEPMKHDGEVHSAQFSADGQRVVTASGDKTARLWDVPSGKPIGEPMRHEDTIYSAKFSPDGQWVVTASEDKTAQLWDALSQKPIGEPMQHGGRVYFAQFSPDGQRVVTASGDKTARLWDVQSGKPLGEPMQHGDRVRSVQFSPDGQRVVTASEDKTVRLWDALSGEPLGRLMKHEGRVYLAQFSSEGQRIVSASEDKTARLWDALSGKPIGETMQHGARVYSAQFSPDGQRVVTTSVDRTTRLWDALSGKPIGEPMQHGDTVISAQFSPDGQRVLTASLDKTARLWDTISGKLIGEPMRHGDILTFARLSPDGQWVVTASNDKTARLWDALSGKPLGKPMQHGDKVRSAQFSPDGQRVVTASQDKTARLWDALSGKPIGEPMRHGDTVTSAQFSPDGQRIVTASEDETARLWDVLSGKPIGEPMQHEDTVYLAQFSPDGQRVVTASLDKRARLWDALSGKPIGEPMRHEDTVTSAQFSPDGQWVVTASADETARLWDALSGKRAGGPMRHGDAVYSAQFSSNSQRVVTASGDKTVRLWDALSGKPIGEPMQHGDMVTSAQFSPDGQRVVTASADTARIGDFSTVSDEDSAEDVGMLADLAEAAGGLQIQGEEEILIVLTSEEIQTRRERIANKFLRRSSHESLTPLQRLLKWSISDPRHRTISPGSQLTVAEWIENTIKEGTLDGLRAAMQVDPANARLAAHLSQRLADEALKEGVDSAVGRRARAEADFHAWRALKMAPENEEVTALCAKVT